LSIRQEKEKGGADVNETIREFEIRVTIAGILELVTIKCADRRLEESFAVRSERVASMQKKKKKKEKKKKKKEKKKKKKKNKKKKKENKKMMMKKAKCIVAALMPEEKI
jgi:sRNA-binding protein